LPGTARPRPRARRSGAAALAAATLLLAGACAGRRIVDGVYHAPAGYRVTLPGASWTLASDTRADLELRHRSASAGMLVNAVCDPTVARRGSQVLAQHLLLGIRKRAMMEADEVPVNGRVASHRLLEGRMPQGEERVRIESYTLKGERCVYDLLYVATPEAFDAWRGDFQRVVDSFVGE
jgi:hypothetical protein